ncbi:unannotated protein [freshwater metagenome]|uniref:Unannotated protein n=1 Tax=freshwater metagenome TaxID=449393 RepID=A0A6J5ZFQ9_9ZZZZ
MLRHDMCEVHGLVLSHRVERVVREPERRRCICEVRELVHHRCTYVEHVLVLHHHGVRGLVLHLYKCVVRGLVLCHRDVRAVGVLVHHRCTYVEHGLDDLLHTYRGIHECLMAFRHPYVGVCRMGSTHHYFACCHGLGREVIQPYFGHLGHEVRAARGIQPLPPWTLAWHASWRQFLLPQHGEVNRLLAWIQSRERDLVRAFGRAAFS